MVETCRDDKKIKIEKIVAQPELFIVRRLFTNAQGGFMSTVQRNRDFRASRSLQRVRVNHTDTISAETVTTHGEFSSCPLVYHQLLRIPSANLYFECIYYTRNFHSMDDKGPVS